MIIKKIQQIAGSFKIVGRLVLVYMLLAALWYGYQHLFFFQPKALDVNHAFSFPIKAKFSTAQIPFDAQTVLDVVKFEADSLPAKGVVLFFHGNRYNVEHYASYAPYFTQRGYACWMVDYPGYGRSTGEMSIDILEQTSIQLYKMANAVYADSTIVIYGKSLGTGIASYLASKKQAKSIVLETPYASLTSLASNYLFFLPMDFLSKYNIESYKQIQKILSPITVLHGTSDELIPVEEMAKILPNLKKQDAVYLFEGGKHNNLPTFKQYNTVMDSLFAQ